MKKNMVIERKKYLDDLILRMNNGLVKVITGIRRSGKSYLLFEIFKSYLLQNGNDENHIIAIALDERKNAKYRNPDAILDYIESLIIDSKKYYILLDEVQLLESFEEVLNSLIHKNNADVYVTGSNSKFLSKDVITEFRGRGDEIHVFPLSFSEFMQVYDGDMYHGWAEYALYGGLPLVATMKSDEQKSKYLKDLFSETYLLDIIERNKIDKTLELEDLINVLASSIGSLTNPKRITDTFKTKLGSSISINTIKSYLDYLEDAFLVSSVHRYDVKGRRYIGTPLKYYFEDIGLHNARLGFRQSEETHIMENVIYNELRYRGFSVDVGVVEKRKKTNDGKEERKQLEIDFVCNQGSKRYYIQSAFSLGTIEKMEQEKSSLVNLNDSFKKIIVVKNVTKVQRDENGIVTMDLYEFLMNPDSLEN